MHLLNAALKCYVEIIDLLQLCLVSDEFVITLSDHTYFHEQRNLHSRYTEMLLMMSLIIALTSHI